MTISLPSTTFNIIPAKQTLSNRPNRVLFVGQMTSAGSAVAGSLVANIQNDGSESALFGKNSMLAEMVRNAKKINQVTRFDAIPLVDNSGGTAATGSIAITGTGTAAGSLFFSVGSLLNHTYEVDTIIGTTAAQVATSLAALINADTNLMVTAVATAGSVALTCVHKGTVGNSIGLAVSGTVAGLPVTLTAMTGGAGNPSVTALFSAVTDQRYQTIVWPSDYAITTLTTELTNRFNATNNVLDGVAIICKTDTFANLLATATSLNSQSVVYLGNKMWSTAAYIGGATFELDCVQAAQFAAIRSLRLTTNANISQYVISTYGQRDSFGGIPISSLPYFNTPFYNLPLQPTGFGFLSTEISQLLAAGCSVLGNNVTNTQLISGDIATTYKYDSAGNPDGSYQFLNFVDTIVASREYFFNNFRSRFAQCRLTSGDLIPNRNMANQQSIAAYAVGLYLNLAGEDYVLLQAGETARNYFIANLVVSLNLQTGVVTLNMQAPIVTQLRTIIGTMQISFSTQG